MNLVPRNGVTIGFGVVLVVVVAWLIGSRLLLERGAITFIDTPAGTIEIGQTREEALPRLETGELLERQALSAEETLETRRFPSGTFQILFRAPPDQPARIIRIRAVSP
jgi:hypothetical protein